MPSLGVIPCEYLDKLYLTLTRMIFLTDAENCMIVSSFVWTKHWNLTEGQTDRQNPLAITAWHCEQCVCIVKK